ncbi:SIMPL domain-containing protein [Streptomyces sp. TRM66268-LWL]|uniref:SIMPL domain-containing protein n=1 Tax=Streptomyces polyasparticus TaxID=2767826 RepID=A0ABR7SAB0_9ACTN|nr:SIMPL domain-containing protein [Streptomyces polyasparticus]MBC9712084.1 SIMPL domain-containing protein [Streptomyces polyasparticus]
MDETPAFTPYGTPDAPRVAVSGEARLEVDPEVARIAVTVSARGRDRRQALDDLTRRNGAVLDLIKSYAEAVEKLETGALSIRPEYASKGRGEHVRTYHGHVRITAVLGDFTALGELATRLADLELTAVEGPWWELRPESPVHGEARRQAVREAVQRAREYAAALDTRLAALVELADVGAEGHHPFDGRPQMMAARGMAYDMEAAEGAAPLDLEPQRQTVYATVNARFTMHPPEL